MSYNLHDRVRWIGVKETSWAWPGTGEVVDYQPARTGFPGGPPRLNMPPSGPAFAVKLDGDKAHIVWLEPDDIMPELPTG